jgi:hypothetical protein
MERILNTCNYPRLYKLTLLNLEQEFAWQYLTGKFWSILFSFF